MQLEKIKLSEYAEMTAYIHEKNTEMGNIDKFPAILVLPGGGFRFCSAREAEPVAMAFYAEGYSAFVLDYTTVTKNPQAKMEDPMADAVNAMKWIRENSDKINTDPNKLVMIGFSGGGHLASAVATHCDEKPDVLVLGYPGIIHSDLRALDCPDIVECIDKNTPPSFIFSTRDDTVVPPKHPLSFACALDDAGVDYELHIFRHGPHGLTMAKTWTSSGFSEYVNADFEKWFPMCISFLKAKLGDFTADKEMKF